MKRTFFILIAITFIFTSAVMAPAYAINVAVLDAQKVVNSTNAAKRAVKSLTKARDDAQAKINKMEAPLLEDRKKLEDRRSVMSEDDFVKAQSQLRKKVLNFRAEAQDIQEALSRQNTQLRKKISDTVKNAVQELAKEKGYDLVLPKALIFYSADALDISDDVLKRANKALDKK